MEAIFCLLVGLFFAASIYLMLSNHLVRILLGVSIFGNAVNLLIFTAGRLSGPAPPVLSKGAGHEPEHAATPALPVDGAADGTAAGATATGALPDAATAAAQGATATTHPITPAMPINAGSDLVNSALDAVSTTANPLPQALILTAIVISFSIFAFLLVLTFRAYQSMDTDNIDDMRVAEGDPVRPPLGY